MTAHFNEDITRLLLDRIPQGDRPTAIEAAAQQLTNASSLADISIVAAFLHLQPETKANDILVRNLISQIENGQYEIAGPVCAAYPLLASQVVEASLTCVVHAAGIALTASKDALVPVSDREAYSFLSDVVNQSSEHVNEVDIRKTTAHLHFLTRLLSGKSDRPTVDRLSQSCLVHIGSRDKDLASAAQKTLLRANDLCPPENQADQLILWARIRDLITAEDVYHRSLGFSLWLRWMICSSAVDTSIICDSAYWDSLVHGLRHGDSERRKGSLQVLRATIDAVLKDEKLSRLITRSGREDSDVSTIRQQYNRFCTLFETIVLGRYLNQVQECEADLDFLVSDHSVVKPIWLYTLLACALDTKMQESNRKFIGSWILRSQLRTDDHDAFVDFLSQALLPWATQGHLYTSSLRRDDGERLACLHGDKLAVYVSGLLQASDDLAVRVFDTVLDGILAKANNNFAYSMVYLMEGIGRAYDLNHALPLTISQLEKANKIVVWAGLLPEVARDFILARLWKMCHTFRARHPEVKVDGVVATSASLWDQLLQKAADPNAIKSAQLSGPMAAIALDPSRREKNEVKAIEKCVQLVVDVKQAKLAPDPAEVLSRLDDIWSDLEYLEYSKGLLMILPMTLLSSDLIEAAGQNNESSLELRERLSWMIQNLFKQAEGRSYLLSPLMESFRAQTVGMKTSPSLFNIAEFVIQLAENPASPTIDAQLEDAAAGRIPSVAPELKGFDYEFYSGQRESYGFAAFLDLVCRLEAIDPAAPEQIVSHVLNRWVTQRTPPATVSPWKSTLQLQILLLSLEQYLPGAGVAEATRVLKDLQYTLSIEPLPRYRYLLEWMVARTYIHYPELKTILFDQLRTKDHHSNPKFLASLMKIGTMLATRSDASELFAVELSTIFAALAASSKVVIRHEAQWQVPVLLDHAKSQDWTSICENASFQALDEFIRSLERFDDPPLERQIDKLDPVANHNLTHLVEGPWWDLDHIEHRQTRRQCFLQLFTTDERLVSTALPPSCMALGEPLSHPVATIGNKVAVDATRKILQNIDNISRALGSGPGPAVLQTKGNAYLESARRRHSNLIVIASLVDNPYNLGGLSRVSEIFGASALYVPNTNVTSSRDFTGVSVSSHLHIPVRALPAADLHAFLVDKRQNEGYTVVGIEQTDRSVLLGAENCVLPEKCILVMGSEKEGIPALILAECGVLVEIPQLGITRSLNVQTAAGIVLCEYAKQFRFK